MLAGKDFIVVDLVPPAYHGMQGRLGMLTQHVPPQHKLHGMHRVECCWLHTMCCTVAGAKKTCRQLLKRVEERWGKEGAGGYQHIAVSVNL